MMSFDAFQEQARLGVLLLKVNGSCLRATM
jgi:hypothetical protein